MANRYTTPVMFAMEKNVTFLYARVVFGASGTAILDTNNSKGICNVVLNTPTFVGNTSSASTTISSVTSFALLYPGMVLSGTSITANTTISSMTQSTTNQTITMSTAANPSWAQGVTLTASGGLYTFQFGTQAALRLDSYYKFLGMTSHWVQTTGSATSSATQVGLIPAAPTSFVVQNNTRQRTIPATTTSGSSDCTLSVIYGSGVATAFLAANPNPGDSLYVQFKFGASSAI